jgi:UDP-GlcNAc:undecaprenyl-phosphate/decaprenyl-phosphate GlcNAc-1-phosphate transferase
MIPFITINIIIFISSLLLSLYFYKIRNRILEIQIFRDDARAVQATHVKSAPRIGGIAIVISFIVGYSMCFNSNIANIAHPKYLLTFIPIFSLGLCEDLGYHTSPRIRIVAATISGLLFIILFSQWISRADYSTLNIALEWPPFAIILTIFIAVSVSHSFNLIDGLNGFASSVGIAAALSLALIAHNVDLFIHRDILIMLAVAISGFLLINFPFGLLFLGDAGAYVIGHILVWTSISMISTSELISPWAILLVFFWPVTDTISAIVRRLLKGMHISKPDRLHFHQLFLRSLEILFLGRKMRTLSNPITTIIVLPLTIIPMLFGVYFFNNPDSAIISIVIFSLLYSLTYKTGLAFALKRNKWKLFRND